LNPIKDDRVESKIGVVYEEFEVIVLDPLKVKVETVLF